MGRGRSQCGKRRLTGRGEGRGREVGGGLPVSYLEQKYPNPMLLPRQTRFGQGHTVLKGTYGFGARKIAPVSFPPWHSRTSSRPCASFLWEASSWAPACSG